MALPDNNNAQAAAPGGTARVLVVEDDVSVRAIVRHCLTAAGYRVLEADAGDKGLALALKEKPALIVLDVALPGLNGDRVAAELRRLGHTVPILMLTTRNGVDDRVDGLIAGADDYLGKPFDRRELLARIHALLRRQTQQTGARRTLRFGDLTVDLAGRAAARGAEPVSLTRTEFSLLDLLARNLGTPVSRELILDAVWGYTYLPTTRTVDTHIYRLRKKLGDNGDEPRWLKKAQGEGYLLDAAVGE